jgi:alkylhydroperoxidase family enzyme
MSPRIPPLSLADADERTRDMLGALSDLRADDTSVLNVFTTMANHPDLLRRWLVFANHVLLKSTLPARERELAILRAGWRCDAPYEWGQHIVVGRRCGVTDADVARIALGPDAPGWSPLEAAILRAVDELHDHSTVSDGTWSALTAALTTEQCMDLVFAIGQYHLVSFALNTFGVERDDGVDSTALPFPDPAAVPVD